MKQETINKREELKALSKEAAKLVKAGVAESVNDALIMIYSAQGHSEINSFNRWKEKGFSVKKGEKALLLWGQPRQVQQQEQKEGDNDEYKFFPLAFVFSNKQVQPSETPHQRR